MKRATTAILILAFHFSVHAQVDTASGFSNEFKKFRSDIVKDYDQFRKNNDSVFLLFLEKSWTEFEGTPNEMPAGIKPEKQPVFVQDTARIKHEPYQREYKQASDTGRYNQVSDSAGYMSSPINQPSINPSDSAAGNLNLMPEPDAVLYDQNITFFGSIIALPPYNSSMPLLKGLTKEAATGYYQQASESSQFREIISQIRMKSIRFGLNDWGYASLLQNVAGFYYTDAHNRNAFLWAAMLMSGINVKLGINPKGAYLLVPADVKLYRVNYRISDKDYYCIGSGSPAAGEKLYIHQAGYPGNRDEFEITIRSAPSLEYNPVTVQMGNDKNLSLTLNRNLIDFYSNYPPCDLTVHFNTPLSESVLNQLDDMFLHLLKDCNDDVRTAMLLRFMQRAFRYETDISRFGHEKYQFPEEVLFHGAGDCEDRSVLFGALLQRYTKLDFIGLRYPHHVSVAVNLSSCVSPAFIQYEGRSFYHCDPTYLGAECGRSMPSVTGLNPQIIKISRHEL